MNDTVLYHSLLRLASSKTFLGRLFEMPVSRKLGPLYLCEGLFSPAIGKHLATSVYLRFVAARLTYRHSPRNPFW